MTPAPKPKKNLSRREQSERIAQLRERYRNKGLQPWVKTAKKENR